MINVIKLFTIVIGTLIFIVDLSNYLKGKNKNITIFVQSVFYFFYYVPLILDVFYKIPIYTEKNHHGFSISYDDFSTEVIYCIIITYLNYMFHFFQKRNVYTTVLDKKNSSRIRIQLYSIILFCTLIGIVIYTITLMDEQIFEALITYKLRHIHTENADTLKKLSFIIVAISLVFTMIEGDKRKTKHKIICMIPFLIYASLINGKKATIFISIVGIIMVLLIKNIIKRKKTIIMIVAIACIAMFAYQKYYNLNVAKEIDNEYTSYRIYYCRDNTLKMTIYSEKNNDRILEYRGESALYYLTFYIPRSVWKEKPYPYAVYFTDYLVNLKKVRPLSWNMTTSIYDEFLSNFGWLGILLIPFLMNFAIKQIHKRNKGMLGKGIVFLGILDIVLLLAVQVSAFLILYIALIVMMGIYDINEKFKKNQMKFIDAGKEERS